MGSGQGQGQGEVGQAHRRRHHADQWQARPARRPHPGALRLHQGAGRGRDEGVGTGCAVVRRCTTVLQGAFGRFFLCLTAGAVAPAYPASHLLASAAPTKVNPSSLLL
ncbi:hypothetical protein CBM2586_B30181 [Cupriavidus phytorum]|uniref:Uncharacterized protein n=1 Tax=Cupriavidus taiwanensis TaxID=164546 RepID=A0A375CKP9_9BURK|nr:hypothetical protein CBM2586_B30181 [Cupriavidus taiwanensis]